MILPPRPTHEAILQAAAKRCQPDCPHRGCVLARVRPIIERHSAATPGPWRWSGFTSTRDLRLATTHSGRHIIMDFVRWGPWAAQPRFQPPGGLMVKAEELLRKPREDSKEIIGITHPDAILMERAWEDLNLLLELLADLLAESAGA